MQKTEGNVKRPGRKGTGVICETRTPPGAVIPAKAGMHAGGAYIVFHVCAPRTRATPGHRVLSMAFPGFLTVADIKGHVGATRESGNPVRRQRISEGLPSRFPLSRE
jgi:hypothetical protein